jgi:hypothetical protein
MKVARASVQLVAVAALLLTSLSGCGGDVTMQASAGGTGSGSGDGGGVGGGVGGGDGGGNGGGGGAPVYAPCEGKACGDPCWCEGCDGPPTGSCDAAGECVMGPPVPGVCSPPCVGPICEVLADGPWLIGWSGGMDHFSWLRFTPVTETGGKLHLLESKCGSCTGYFNCEGEGTYWIGPAGNPNDPNSSTIAVELPASCSAAGAPSTDSLLITNIAPANGFPASAERTASVFQEGSQNWLEGYQYPPSQCDAAFAMCSSPFN